MAHERQEPRGLVIVNTGHGKGKTTAALGLAMRAAGNNLRVYIIQFIKGRWKTGDGSTRQRSPEGIVTRPVSSRNWRDRSVHCSYPARMSSSVRG